MAAHALFSPSGAARWINCPGSVAFDQTDSGSRFSDEGTAAHILAERCFTYNRDAEFFLGEQIQPSATSAIYVVDESMAYYVQIYVDDVRRRSLGCKLLTEQRVDLSEVLGVPNQFGTADTIIVDIRQKMLIVEDLKYGKGEPVSVFENFQLMLYGLAALRHPLVELLCDEIEKVRLVIAQPRIGSGEPSEWDTTPAELETFRELAVAAVNAAGKAMTVSDVELQDYLNPTDKGCRWCKVAGSCDKLAAKVQAEVGADFDVIEANPPTVPTENAALSLRFNALPLIDRWVQAVREELNRRLTIGEEIVGTDGQPLKFVEGRKGKSYWTDPATAEGLLVGQIADKAYQPRKVITAPAAKKILGKKATKALWDEHFVPLIDRKQGKAHIALGSDPRPAFKPAATADEFDEINEGDE